MPNLAELSTLEPNKLHAWAKRFNWDEGLFGPTLALRNRRCALATALLLYWRAKPRFYRQWTARKDVPAEERKAFDLLRAIEKALRAGAFAPRGIAYDPRDDLGSDFTAVDYPKEAKVRDLPPEVLVWTDGKKAYPLAPPARATTAEAKPPSRGTPKNTPTPTKPATARKNTTKTAAARAAPPKPTAEKPTAKKTAEKTTANTTTKKPTTRNPTAKKAPTRSQRQERSTGRRCTRPQPGRGPRGRHRRLTT
jgi:hypothetical protein